MADNSNDWQKQVGERLRAVRLAKGYETAREFSYALGVQENTYTMWERGHRLVNPQIMSKIRAITGATMDYIYCGDASSLPNGLFKKLEIEP